MKQKLLNLLAGMVLVTALPAAAQIGITFDAFPYQNFSKPIPGAEDAEVQSSSARLDLSFPLMARQRTQLDVGLSLERRSFQYRGFGNKDPDIDAAYGSQLSFTLMHGLSEKWTLMTIVTPGLASDLRGDLSVDDFNFQAIVAGIKTVSPRFTYGVGVAYSTQFGEPIPLPVLLFDWNNGKKLSWKTILPISSELWYAHSSRLHLGMLLGVTGNSYQGNPERYDVDDPEMRYSVVTIGPSARIAVTPGVLMQIDAGFTPYHRFEFFDGSEKLESYNVKSNAFLRLGLRFGG